MMKMMIVVLLLTLGVVVHCHSTGAPADACSDIYPVGHSGTSRDLSTSPFNLSLSDFDHTYGGEFYYVPGQQYTFTLSGIKDFRGFLVQARTVADGSPVGIFTVNGPEQTLSLCTPSDSAITHSNNDLKSSVEFVWTAPTAGTGQFQFLFAVVVQNSGGVSEFYSTIETDVLNSCSFPLYKRDSRCVETCPNGEFGNATSGTCQPLPPNYVAVLNATQYYAQIGNDYPLNTPVFNIRVITSTNTYLDLSLSLSQNALINPFFEYDGGSDNEISIPTSALVPVGGYYVFDTSMLLVSDPTATFDNEDYPVELEIEIALVGLLTLTQPIQVVSLASGYITDPCHSEPCNNGGTCENFNTTEYHCYCIPGYYGINCEEVDYCFFSNPCTNGNCTAATGSDYTCNCYVGYTGTNCDIDIDDCLTNDCVNGSCVDGIAEYTCECDTGFTGSLCNQDINDCDTANCNNGTCIDLVNDYMCSCYQDYTGEHCEEVIDDCASDPCSSLHSTGCEDGNVTFFCQCLAGFTGGTCDVVMSCESNPCANEATCTNKPLGEFSCECPPRFTGLTCSDDLFPCTPNPCENQGTCFKIDTDFSCECALGWTGTRCQDDINECLSNPCTKGGICSNLNGSYHCMCPSSNLNRTNHNIGLMDEICVYGMCIDGYGTNISCNCTAGFTGPQCDQDDTNITFCNNTTCANGGTCNEEFGNTTTCSCAPGFSGPTCSNDLDYCNKTTCANGGVCSEGLGLETTCLCEEGFTGPVCEENLLTCSLGPCKNGATCMEDSPYNVRCQCLPQWMGNTCTERARLEEADNKVPTLFIVTGALVMIIIVLCGFCLLGNVMAIKNHGRKLVYNTAGHKTHNNHYTRTSFTPTLSNYTTAIELSQERADTPVTERESQEERWQFEMYENENRYVPPETSIRNDNTSPTESLVQQQYNLSLAMVSTQTLTEYSSENNLSGNDLYDEHSGETNES